MNCRVEGHKAIESELRKARMGLAHILMYIEKSQELSEGFETTPANYETLNPKDDGFVYF